MAILMFRSRWKRQILNCAPKLRRSGLYLLRDDCGAKSRQLALQACSRWRDWLTSGWLSGLQARCIRGGSLCQSAIHPVQVRWKSSDPRENSTVWRHIQFIEVPLQRFKWGNQGQGSRSLPDDTRLVALWCGLQTVFERSGAAVINGESLVRWQVKRLSMQAINAVTATLVIRPVVTMDKLKSSIAEKLILFKFIQPFRLLYNFDQTGSKLIQKSRMLRSTKHT